jgi:CheY-like chemotaxis protein
MDCLAAPILGDADRLQQVFWNLLSNAVRFTPRGGLVQVRLRHIGSDLEIVVSDSGAGIAPEFLPHVFERFRQADSRLSREYGGLGLGLAISHELIELHGGTIRAESDGAGKGATFSVRLLQSPFSDTRVDTADQRRRAEPREQAMTTVDLTGLQILVVDDDSDALSLMREVLEAAGATVICADSGRQALIVLDERTPHAIVSDLGMPGMDGFELLAELRRSPVESLRNIPVAALTAYGRSEDRTRSLRSGWSDTPFQADRSARARGGCRSARQPVRYFARLNRVAGRRRLAVRRSAGGQSSGSTRATKSSANYFSNLLAPHSCARRMLLQA